MLLSKGLPDSRARVSFQSVNRFSLISLSCRGGARGASRTPGFSGHSALPLHFLHRLGSDFASSGLMDYEGGGAHGSMAKHTQGGYHTHGSDPGEKK